MRKKGCLWILIITVLLWILIILIIGCRVQSPKQRGFVLTPDGWALKDTLTTSEKKLFREWHKLEKQKITKPN